MSQIESAAKGRLPYSYITLGLGCLGSISYPIE